MMKTITIAAVLLVSGVNATSAQTAGPIVSSLERESARLARAPQPPSAPAAWASVHEIDARVRITVVTRDDVVAGEFLAADRFGVTLDRGDRVVQVPIDDVIEIRATERHVGRGIGIGAAIGGALAGALVIGKMGSGDGFYQAVAATPIVTGVGIGIGAAAGAQPSTRIVYRAATSE